MNDNQANQSNNNIDPNIGAEFYPNPEDAQVTHPEEFADTQPLMERQDADDATFKNIDQMAEAIGVETNDFEAVRIRDKVAERDRNRYQLDPDSAEDH